MKNNQCCVGANYWVYQKVVIQRHLTLNPSQELR